MLFKFNIKEQLFKFNTKDKRFKFHMKERLFKFDTKALDNQQDQMNLQNHMQKVNLNQMICLITKKANFYSNNYYKMSQINTYSPHLSDHNELQWILYFVSSYFPINFHLL